MNFILKFFEIIFICSYLNLFYDLIEIEALKLKKGDLNWNKSQNHNKRNYSIISAEEAHSITADKRSKSNFYSRNHKRMEDITSGKFQAETFERLPQNVRPIHYNVKLKPDLETFVIEGSETINLEVFEESEFVSLNANDITINKIFWEAEGGNAKQKAAEFSIDDDTEILKIKFDPALPVGKGNLSIEFKGIVNDRLKGCYRSAYKENGETKYNAVTQFQSTDARKCFPCWDEPAIKATFDITLTVPKDKVTVGNMPAKKITPCEDPKLQVIEFERTPIMSTYLIAFVIGAFEYVEAISDGITNRVYTAIGKKEQGQFALNTSTKVLKFYTDYFKIPYPLPKVDMVAIADFSAGAMENWGLITYRETALLVDPNESSSVNQQWVAIVVAHEVAHQWFGNLVTMDWWTDLWLNEGFASFVEFLSCDHIYPEYDVWSQFISDTFIPALKLDALSNSHPVEVPINHPSEIDEAFDDISYNKGASIIRMLYYYIGDEHFRKGMNIYLDRFKYKNTNTVDLWKALEESSGKPIEKVMSTWTKQMGFPLITVEASKQDGNNRILTLTQEKFCSSYADMTESDKDYFWMVPLSFTTSHDPINAALKILMDKKTLKVTIPNIGKNDWVKLNSKVVGYYRVNYTSEMLSQFVEPIRTKQMHSSDRLIILDDLFALVQSGQKSTVEVFKLLEAFSDEDDYPCWVTINSIMNKLDNLLSSSEKHDKFRSFAKHVLKNIAGKIGWEIRENDGHKDKLLRSMILNKMVTYGDESTITEAKKRFEDHSTKRVIIPADLRTVSYRGALSGDNDEMYQRMISLYIETEMHEEKERVGASFSVLRNADLIQKFLEFTFSDDVRSQSATHLIGAVTTSKTGRELAWEFFKNNWETIKYRYTGFLLAYLCKSVIQDFVTAEKGEEVEDFFNNHKMPGTERVVQQSLENIKIHQAWLERDLKEIENFLDSY